MALVFLFHAIPFSFAQTPTDSLFIQQIRRLGQIEDSLRVLKISIDRVNRDLALTGTRLISAESEGEERKLSFGGYVSTYFASYSDTSGGNGYQKFPTISPRNNAFGLDMALISTRYVSQSLRGTITLHLGDIPSSAWSATYNLVQEANLGFKLGKKWWLDGGFFRTHIGLESIQPRENICQSIALVTYFEPYFLSGAKLSFLASDQVTAQVQILNSFNGFVGQNVRKAVGASVLWTPRSAFSLTSNILYSDGSLKGQSAEPRLYWNTFLNYKTLNWLIGAELNLGIQRSINPLNPGEGTVIEKMGSAMVLARRKVLENWFGYGRFEFYRDPDEMLTGPLVNSNHQLIGLQSEGLTLGVEYKPMPNAQFRIESRGLYTRKGEDIFAWNGKSSSARIEILAGMGVWF